MNVLFTSINQQPIAIKLITIGSPTSGNHTYKTDTLTSSQQYSVGDWITTESGFIEFSYDIKSGQNSSNYYKFVTSGADLAISGLFNSTQNYAYCHLFDGCKTIVDVSEVRFSGFQARKHMCEEMFANCTSLTVAPSTLPQGTGEWCFAGMFFNCTSLKDFPAAIKNTYSAKTGAFSWMFMNCTSLTGAPALNIFNSIAPYLYNSMFQNCTSLTDAPEIKLLAMREGCFKNMFMGCKNLSSITVDFFSWDRDGTTDATENWVKGVASNGVFNKPNNLSAEYGVSRIPLGWNRTLETITVDQIPLININVPPYSESITSYISYTGSEEVKYMINGQLPNGVSFENGVFYSDASKVLQDQTTTVQLIVLADDAKPVIVPVTVKAEVLPLTFVGLSNTANGIKLNIYDHPAPDPINLSYKKNNDEWTTYNIGDIISLQKDETVSFSGANDHFSKSYSSYYYFTMTGNIEVKGNIQSLMSFDTSLTPFCYANLFFNTTNNKTQLREASGLVLPATTMASACYQSMFAGCTNLKSVPIMKPATELAVACYGRMFAGCSNISSVPENYLPNTELAYGCYYGMFASCSKLSTAPSLPATTLAPWCYANMFLGCTSLTTAPELSATELADVCYHSMFSGCTHLKTTPSILPATTLVPSCYYSMFAYCPEIREAPQLPAIILQPNCYMRMFYGCKSLSSMNVSFTSWNDSIYGTSYWVANVGPRGVFYKPEQLPKMFNSSRIRDGWTVINK